MSDWLISPKFSTISNGDWVRFQMRASSLGHLLSLGYQNLSLELRVSANGSCSPGDSHDSVGDFRTRSLSLLPSQYRGPDAVPTGVGSRVSYPMWREQVAVIAGLPAGDNAGCFALRLTAPSAYPLTPLVGVDSFAFEEREPTRGQIALLDPLPPSVTRYSGVPLRGRADPGATVEFFANANCIAPAASTVSSDELHWPGAAVRLPADSTSEVSARSIDPTDVASPCHSIGKFTVDTLAPVTTDNVADPQRASGAVTLSATDSGTGIEKTYYATGYIFYPSYIPWLGFKVYDPEHPPVLKPGEELTYFSVDRAGNVEQLQHSARAPIPPAPVEPPAGPTGTVESSSAYALIRLSRGSLVTGNGRVGLALSCRGPAKAKPCAGEISVRAQMASSNRFVTVTPTASYALDAGEAKSISIRLSRAARTYLAHRRGPSPWSQVLLSPAAAVEGQQTTFRRKLLP